MRIGKSLRTVLLLVLAPASLTPVLALDAPRALDRATHRLLALAQAEPVRWLGLLAREALGADGPSPAPAGPSAALRIEAGFSPEGSAEALVLKVLGTARRSIRLQAYSFTSPAVVRALIAAKRRGVDVAVVVDADGNRSRASLAALNLLAGAGVAARTLDAYAIHHDKAVVVDRVHVQTGSFNYSSAAARRNSENVVVVWNDPALADAYLKHWKSRWERGRDFVPSY